MAFAAVILKKSRRDEGIGIEDLGLSQIRARSRDSDGHEARQCGKVSYPKLMMITGLCLYMFEPWQVAEKPLQLSLKHAPAERLFGRVFRQADVLGR
jgi:hypothetical protein